MPPAEPPPAQPFPAQPGTYALLLAMPVSQPIQVGKAQPSWSRRFDFPAGSYLYVGSALGSGGLAGRLNRHMKPEKRRRWHVDYLAPPARLKQVWYVQCAVRREHAWAALIGQLPGATIPVPRFGASDCNCPAHLYHFRERPDIRSFRRLAGRLFPADKIVQVTLA